jgi:hypothetical protein
MRVVIRSSSLLFSILGIILQAPVAKVKKKKAESEEPPAPPVQEQPKTED